MKTPLSGLRKVRTHEDVTSYTDFIRMAALVMTEGGDDAAEHKAEALGFDRVVEAMQGKAAQAAGNTSAAGLATYGNMAGQFVDRSAQYGAFDRVADAAVSVADFVGRAAIFTGITAGALVEGAAKPLKRVALTSTDFTPVKTAATVVLTRELIDGLRPEGMRALERELLVAVAIGSDTEFLSALSGESGEEVSSAADTFDASLNTIEEVLRQLNLGIGSKPFLILSPENAKALAIQAYGSGVTTLQWNGGNIAGVEILVSQAQTADRVTAVDATGLVVKRSEIELRSSEVASIQMDDAAAGHTSATSVGQVQQVSMFQTNSRCLICERSMAVKAFRPGTYAHMTGFIIGEDSGSPAGV